MKYREEHPLLGYCDSATQKEPTFNPGLEVDCPICSEQLNREDIRTISLMLMHNPNRSYFYRVHKSCHEGLSQQEQDDLDSSFVENSQDNLSANN